MKKYIVSAAAEKVVCEVLHAVGDKSQEMLRLWYGLGSGLRAVCPRSIFLGVMKVSVGRLIRGGEGTLDVVSLLTY